jgi:hypothetical protein
LKKQSSFWRENIPFERSDPKEQKRFFPERKKKSRTIQHEKKKNRRPKRKLIPCTKTRFWRKKALEKVRIEPIPGLNDNLKEKLPWFFFLSLKKRRETFEFSSTIHKIESYNITVLNGI